MKTYLRLLKYASPIWMYAIPYFICVLLYAIFNAFNFVMIMPIVKTLFATDQAVSVAAEIPKSKISIEYIEYLVNKYLMELYGHDYDKMKVLVALSVIVVISVFLSNLFRYLSQRTMEHLRITTLERLRNGIFERTMGLHVGFFSNERKGDIISKITADVQVIQFCITNTLQVAFRDPFLIITYLGTLIFISGELTIFTGLFLPITGLAIGIIVKKLRSKARAAQDSFGDMVSLLDESLTGVKVIKGYNATDYVVNKFKTENGKFSNISRSMANRQQLASPTSEFLGVSAVAVILIYGGSMVMGGRLEAAQFIGYLAIFSQVTRPVRSFMDSFATIHQGIAAGDRVFSLIDTEPEVVSAPDAKVIEGFNDKISLNNVCFSYENRQIINDVSFTINRGETVALVGPSGGGKSTLSDLIPRFYDVQKGSITVDGIDVKNIEIESLRSLFSIVSQETILFNDTVENNIKLGNQSATREEVIAAAKIANAHDFIMQTDNGYDTNTGDRGLKLSGGQRQRISIARAVLKNPDILILDEATSALDTESEKLVQESLNNLLKGRTSLVIAHRLSTIQNADKIIVIDEGRIAETGTHDELIAKGGIYSKLIEMQQLK